MSVRGMVGQTTPTMGVKQYLIWLLLVLLVSCCCCLSLASEQTMNDEGLMTNFNADSLPPEVNSRFALNENLDHMDVRDNYDKRLERYAFGLGRRAYIYPSTGDGIKRFPVYNFGLGKRAQPYSYDLATSRDLDDNDLTVDDLEDILRKAIVLENEKRNRPYSFGLGKRDKLKQEVQQSPPRVYASRYGFGLGR